MEMARKKRDPKKAALAQAILDAYQPETAEDMNDALKDLFGPMIEAMLQGEMDHHLGYASNDKGPKKDSNRRNGCRASYSITETLYQRFGDLLFFKQ